MILEKTACREVEEEPEVFMDGDHSIERCAAVTEKTLRIVFDALARHQVHLEYIILKPNMIVPGKLHQPQSSITEVAQATVKVLRRTVPAAVPTINFLSGGQTDVESTAHLNAMHTMGDLPWNLSFSYGRALQDACLKTWQGKTENIPQAQKVFHHRAEMNALACLGKYQANMEH